jgi:hypothetical protein
MLRPTTWRALSNREKSTRASLYAGAECYAKIRNVCREVSTTQIDLAGVEVGGQTIVVRGGLRLNYYFGRTGDVLPHLRAGDCVEVLCRAHIPRNYQDPGAFDDRGFLKRQDIELLGTLRSTELIETDGPASVSRTIHTAFRMRKPSRGTAPRGSSFCKRTGREWLPRQPTGAR